MSSGAYQAVPIDLDEYFGGGATTPSNSSPPSWLDTRRKRWIVGGAVIFSFIGLITLIIILTVRHHHHHHHNHTNKYVALEGVSLASNEVNNGVGDNLLLEEGTDETNEISGKFHDLWLSDSGDYPESSNTFSSEDGHF
eukprot:CAMPEP_0178938282 /NCGR_PEP_ID=MMETSP0786-20121207/26244_1 /TAXON_ID=186022 /ORGANISM="Thalassionema frauenfeldii, Strain CCMP 1798" /LENGTH=138 /DNA_ID=CAMNT_0020616983 /DNA_START=38 /DNA_END=454 /DNA_ORIENTATION=-